MTFGYALILGLVLLTPGFAAYAGLFVGSQARGYWPAPPAPASLISFAIVCFGALIAHAAGALLLWINDGLVSAGLALITVAQPPNPYVYLATGADPANPPGSWQIVQILSGMLLLSIIAFEVTRRVVRSRRFTAGAAPLLYGWLAETVREASAANRYVTAFVLTDIGHEGLFLGYEGLLSDLTLTSDKEIASLALADCTRFRLKLGEAGLERFVDSDDILPLLYLERGQIKNIALQVYEVADEAET